MPSEQTYLAEEKKACVVIRPDGTWRGRSWRFSVRLAAPILLGVMRGCEPSNDGSLVAEVVVGDLAQDPQDRTDGNQKKDQATSAAI